MPTDPSRPQLWQRPVHAVPQQIPRTQKLERHSWVAPHASPFSLFATQPLLMQTALTAQSPFPAQVLRHMPVVQPYGAHEALCAGRQVPVPLQVRADVRVTPLHEAGAHSVPAAYCRQAPMPLQNPSVVHDFAPASLHCSKGSCPAGMGTQEPTLPGTLHA